MMNRAIKAVLAASLAAFAAACGGKVVINENELGQSGAGDTPSTGAGSGLTCSWPEPEGDVIFCGPPAGGECGKSFCDDNGSVYEAACSEGACKCKWNGVVKCTCAGDGTSNYCDGVTPPCCPAPIQ